MLDDKFKDFLMKQAKRTNMGMIIDTTSMHLKGFDKEVLYSLRGNRAEVKLLDETGVVAKMNSVGAVTQTRIKEFLAVGEPKVSPTQAEKSAITSPRYIYAARVVSVYDGDTITVDISLGLGIYKKDETIRLKGIDTPEVRGSEKEAGIKARDYLRERILNKEVIIKTYKDSKGKYGRYLAEIFIDGENINKELVDKGYAKSY